MSNAPLARAGDLSGSRCAKEFLDRFLIGNQPLSRPP